ATAYYISTSSISISPSGSIFSVFEFDAPTQNYLPSSMLNPGKGYWIFINNSGTLWVPGE
ncbi:hypothetical protein J7L68_07785, partial [bacterium]|nr:hypothetical protein [bacterium]